MAQKRNGRASVEDRWYKTIRDEHGETQTMPGARHGVGMRWRARYVGPDGREYSNQFARKTDAQAWVNKTTTELGTHTWVDPARSP